MAARIWAAMFLVGAAMFLVSFVPVDGASMQAAVILVSILPAGVSVGVY